ncbi:unnamed protein product [Phyllotreta striolata]|uniref:Leucine-rich repeat-containing protein 34 n=1 Tax=Phyllotreta striolata TaxID=444603 RepID=A0A9N9TL17_PHYSR|nr:unnamed protein product [Phyllotreta striolata]
MSVMGDKLLNENFIQLFVENNSDGTKHLRLKGKELYMRFGTRLKQRHMRTVATFLRKNPEIISVDLCYNDFGNEGLDTLTEYLFDHPNNIEYMNLMQCDITAEGIAKFSSATYNKIRLCRLNGNKIGASGAVHIGRLIQVSPTLEILDIAETDQTLESIESLLIIIEASNIKVLDISRIIPNSYYTKYNQATLADDLSIALKSNEKFVELHIQKIEFDGHDVEILLNGLRENKSLEVLDLGYNLIADYGAELIATWLTERPNLKGLNLAGNRIGTIGARAMSFGLPFSKLRFLDMSNNRIQDQELTDLLDSLKKTPKLRIFFLWGNHWEEVACKRLHRMFASGVIEQEYVDVQICVVDGKYQAVHYPANAYKATYYALMKFGYPETLRIKRNVIDSPRDQPRALLNLTHIGRYPPVDKSLGPKVPKTVICPEEPIVKEEAKTQDVGTSIVEFKLSQILLAEFLTYFNTASPTSSDFTLGESNN